MFINSSRNKIFNGLFKPSIKGMFSNAPKFGYASHLVNQGKQKIVGTWLLLAATGVLGMIVLGGYTRLTHSGLSMADWKPYTKVYPRNDQQWEVQFAKYRKCVEYQTVNKDMTLQGFKPIYRVQFVHRQMGMYLGYFFMFPLAFFTYKGYLKPTMKKRLFALLALGGLQGGIGWWMVKSGLNQKPDYQSRPRVSPYRLMTHLMMATTIYAGLIWNSFSLLFKPKLVNPQQLAKIAYLRKIRIISIIMIKCILLNILTGAIVAGIGAGDVYNTWPLMNGKIIPTTAFQRQPKWKNFFQNRALTQFNHRTMAYVTGSLSYYMMYLIIKNKFIRHPATYAGIIAFLMINYQAVSGIITLLNLVPKQKANMHQMTAILTMTSVIGVCYFARVPGVSKNIQQAAKTIVNNKQTPNV